MTSGRSMELNEKDLKIIQALKENARLGVKDIARKTGIPITTVFNRIRSLEKDGIIEGYSVIIDRKKLGKDIQAFILVNIAYTSKINPDDFSRELLQLPEVEDCYVISGATNILIKVSTKDIDDLNDFIITNLKKRGIENTTTYIIIRKF